MISDAAHRELRLACETAAPSSRAADEDNYGLTIERAHDIAALHQAVQSRYPNILAALGTAMISDAAHRDIRHAAEFMAPHFRGALVPCWMDEPDTDLPIVAGEWLQPLASESAVERHEAYH